MKKLLIILFGILFLCGCNYDKQVEPIKDNIVNDVKEEVKDVDYSKMTVAELKEVAREKNINVTGMKKAEIVAELSK